MLGQLKANPTGSGRPGTSPAGAFRGDAGRNGGSGASTSAAAAGSPSGLRGPRASLDLKRSPLTDKKVPGGEEGEWRFER
jgi:hypothetical protein